MLISLKILQATEHFLPDAEKSIERFVYELSRGLMCAGQDVTVLTGGRGRSKVLGGVRIEYASIYGNHMARWASNLNDQRITNVPAGVLKMYRRHPDIVHAHYFGSGYAAYMLKKYDGTPYILTIHLMPSMPAGPAPLCRPMYQKALENADAVVSISNDVRETVKSEFGVDSVVIPLSMDTAVKGYMAVYESAVKA